MTRTRNALAAAALGLLLVGCGSSGDNGAEPTPQAPTESPAEPTTPETSPGVTVESTDGTVAINGSGQLPDSWPSEVVLPDGGTIVSSVSADQGGNQGWNVVVTYDEQPADVADAFGASLTGAGFTQQSKYTSGDTTLVAYASDAYSVALTITPGDGGGTSCGLTVSTS